MGLRILKSLETGAPVCFHCYELAVYDSVRPYCMSESFNNTRKTPAEVFTVAREQPHAISFPDGLSTVAV